MAFFQYRVDGRVAHRVFRSKTGSGRSLTYHAVYLSPELERSLRFGRGNKLRFEGEFEGLPLQGAWQSEPGKGHYAMVSPRLLEASGKQLGDEVTLVFNVVADDVVLVPDELADALARQPKLEKKWEALTPGQRRGQLVALDAAKTPATRARRLQALLKGLRDGTPAKRGS